MSAKVIALYNQKGGVGKTTISVNLAYMLNNKFNKKVLLIDFDPQNTASTMVNLETHMPGAAEYEGGALSVGALLQGIVWYGEVPKVRDIHKTIIRPKYKRNKKVEKSLKWEVVEEEFGFDMLPGYGKDLSLIELAFMSNGRSGEIPFLMQSNHNRQYSSMLLKMVVDIIKKNFDYDYIIIDTNPSLGILSMNALIASEYLIIPTTLDYIAAVGIRTILNNLEDLKNYVNNFQVLGILLNMYSKNRTYDREVEEDIYKSFGEEIPVLKTRLPERQQVKSANGEERIGSQIKGDFAEAMEELANEIETYFEGGGE